MSNVSRVVTTCVLGSLLAAPAALAADWPTYRCDVARSGIAGEALKAPLSEDWTFRPLHGPRKAWGDPQAKPVENILELPRMRFDDAFHAVAAGGMVYFGSSADQKVYALDAASGEVRWTFETGGPVRLPPTVWQGKVYAGSDDGMVYCLDARDGRVVWSFSAAPSPRRILGNGRMISVWPVRTGVLVDGGVAYFGAGIWPAEGLYLYAVDAATGKRLWVNDTYAQGGMAAISPQGPLVASEGKLFLPAGRCMPAAFDRRDGRFLFQRNLNWRLTGLFGGWYCVLAGGVLYTGTEQLVGMREDDGGLALTEGLRASTHTEGERRIVADRETVYLLTGQELVAANAEQWTTVRKRRTELVLRRESLGRRQGDVAAKEAPLKQQREAGRKAGGELPPPTPEHQALLDELAGLKAQLAQAAAEAKEWEKREPGAVRWRAPCDGSDELVLAGGTVFAGAGPNVRAFDAASGKETWSAQVSGEARGLAVAGGRLIVSTDSGAIHCFVPGSAARGRKVAPRVVAEPFPSDADTAAAAKLAERIVADSGVMRGFALVLGDDGRLALELARRTELMVYLAEPDAAKAALAGAALTAAGVGGARVAVVRCDPRAMPFSDYFANLIVCTGPASAGKSAPPAAELYRMLKPCGGVAWLAGPGGGDALSARRREFGDVTFGLGEGETAKVAAAGEGASISRGPLPGAGNWTHQYAEPGNTACSDDARVGGGLGILWYGEPGPERMCNRHSSAAAPLAVDGRLFIQGEEVILAYDAYNGVKLWERQVKGGKRLDLKRRCSNLAAGADSVFVATGDRCLRLDAATGEVLHTYQVPAPPGGAKARDWEYVACVGDVLYGSRGGECVFAVDLAGGQRRWVHDANAIDPVTICIAGGRMFFVQRDVTGAQRAEATKGVDLASNVDRFGRNRPPDVRLAVALDASTGRPAWQRPVYVGDCVEVGRAGGDLTVMSAQGVVLLCGQPWNGHFWKEFMAGQFSRRALIALSAEDGSALWSARKGYRSRPLIVGQRIIAEPWSHELATGSELMRVHPVTGQADAWQISRPGHHCGNIAAAPGALFFRSGTLAYYDLEGDYGTAHFGGQRPGCWINCLPACGLVLMPEASSGCICAFSLQCTIVFQPHQPQRMWGMFSAPGPLTPAGHLAINFGAPGDRKDSRGTLWLAYPRPMSKEKDYDQRLVLDFKLGATVAKDAELYAWDAGAAAATAGAQAPADAWIASCGWEGLQRCSIPLIGAGATPADYTVRLHFAEPQEGPPGRRAMDVKLQGRTVLTGFDPAAEAGGPRRAVVKEFRGVRVMGELVIELEAGAAKPILAGVEAVREGR